MKTPYKYILGIVLLFGIGFPAMAIDRKDHKKENRHGDKRGHWRHNKVKARFTFHRDACTVNFTDKSFFDRSGKSTATITRWEWSFGDGTKDTVQNPSHMYTKSGKYRVRLNVTSYDSVHDRTSRDHKTKMVRVKSCNTPPTPPKCELEPKFTYTIDSNKVHFTDKSTAGSGTFITKWYWYFGDGTVDSTQNPTHTYSATGNYDVCLNIIGTNGTITCSEIKCGKIEFRKLRTAANGGAISITSIHSNLLNVYPNPANIIAGIEFNLSENTQVNITIVDVQGKTVATLVNDNLTSGSHKAEWIPGSTVTSGIYFVVIKAANTIERKQLVLNK